MSPVLSSSLASARPGVVRTVVHRPFVRVNKTNNPKNCSDQPNGCSADHHLHHSTMPFISGEEHLVVACWPSPPMMIIIDGKRASYVICHSTRTISLVDKLVWTGLTQCETRSSCCSLSSSPSSSELVADAITRWDQINHPSKSESRTILQPTY